MSYGFITVINYKSALLRFLNNNYYIPFSPVFLNLNNFVGPIQSYRVCGILYSITYWIGRRSKDI